MMKHKKTIIQIADVSMRFRMTDVSKRVCD